MTDQTETSPEVVAAPPAEQPAAPQLPESLPRAQLQKFVADFGKIVSDHGIDTAEYVTLGGVRQWITIRGQDQRLPVLLYLHGGPGGAISDMSYMFQRTWEEYFTVVQWDQRGFGRSAVDADKLAGTLNKDQVASDAIELIEHLLARFGQEKIILVGQSWGSLLGLLVAKRRPDLLHVLTTIGQVAMWDGNFEYTRQSLIKLAQETGDKELEDKMVTAGTMPDPSDEAARAAWVTTVQMEMGLRGYSYRNAVGENFGERFNTALMMSPAVDADRFDMMTADTGLQGRVNEMTASLTGWDARTDIGSLEVPYVIFHGTWDWQTPVDLARIWFEACDAPWKLWIDMEHSAHFVVTEEPAKTIVELVTKVLPVTRGEIPAGAIRRAN